MTGYVYMYKRALYRDARRTHTKWFCIARERVPMQRERVLLPTKRFAITVRLVAKGRAWRAGVEAVHGVHGERVWRPCMASGCAGLCARPGFYSHTSTYRLHTTHHTTIHTRVLHLTDYMTHLTYGCNPYTLTRACTLRLNPSLGLPSARTLRLNPSLGLPSARTLRFSTPAWEYRPLRPP